VDLNLGVGHASNAIGSRSAKLSLAIECTELRFILDKVVLTVLKNSLVIKPTNTTLAFGLGILVRVFYFLFSLIHVAGPYRFRFVGVAVQGAAQNILGILHVESLVAIGAVAGYVDLVAV